MNIKHLVQMMKHLFVQFLAFGRKHGTGFVIYAIIVNIFDELVLPLAIGYRVHPAAGIAMMGADLDWLTYPLYFLVVALFEK